jgi:TRAP-type C4-dicarboxylate transport system permease small subunit
LSFGHIFERFCFFLAVLSAGLILFVSLLITYDVSTRYFFDFSSPWAFDLSEYSLVWISFLGAPWVLLQNRHVRIDMLVERLPVRVQKFLGVAVSLVASFMCGVLAWRTGIAAFEYYNNEVMMPRIWRIPRIFPYVAIPLGSGLLSIAFLVRMRLYFYEVNPEDILRERASMGQEKGLLVGEKGEI